MRRTNRGNLSANYFIVFGPKSGIGVAPANPCGLALPALAGLLAEITKRSISMTDQTRTWLMRGVAALALLVVGGVAGWMMHGPGDDVAKISFYKDWRLACPANTDQKGACELATDVVDQKSNQRIAQITVSRESDKSDAKVMVVSVPLTVFIPAGLGVQIGKAAAQTYQYSTCIPSGCIVMVPVDDKMFAALSGAPSVTFSVQTDRGTTINIPVQMGGYDIASKRYTQNEAKRHSWWQRLWS